MFVCVFLSACVRACACVCLYAQAVLAAHDTVAQKSFDPVLPLLPEELEEELEEESVKIVRLVKNKEPLVRGQAPSGTAWEPPLYAEWLAGFSRV